MSCSATVCWQKFVYNLHNFFTISANFRWQRQQLKSFWHIRKLLIPMSSARWRCLTRRPLIFLTKIQLWLTNSSCLGPKLISMWSWRLHSSLAPKKPGQNSLKFTLFNKFLESSKSHVFLCLRQLMWCDSL